MTSDGTVDRLSLTLGEVVPSTDPLQPYLAYADAASGKVQVVVVDVTTGAEAARVDVPGVSDWGGWEAPPVALDGEDVFVGSQSGTLVVNWRTGEVDHSDASRAGTPTCTAAGRSCRTVERCASSTPARGRRSSRCPPRAATRWCGSPPTAGWRPWPLTRCRTHQASTSTPWTPAHTSVVEDGDPYSSGWTALSQYYSVTQDGVLTCLSGGDPCHTQPLPEGLRLAGLVRLGGVVYES